MGGAKSFKKNSLYYLFHAFNQKKWLQKILKSACPIIFLTTLAFGDVTSDSLQSVSAGYSHTCGITTDASKSVYCWGDNSTNPSLPERVVGGEQGGAYLIGISQISAGFSHDCAVSGGGVYCWGTNSDGQLGNNSTTTSKVPVKVVGGEQGGAYLENICEVSVTINGSCGVTTVGEVYCWGNNDYGQLGNNSTTGSLVPVKVVGGEQGGPYLTGVSQVSTVMGYTCGVTIVGEVYCWGSNDSGLLGNNSTTDSLVPVKVVGGEQGGTYLTGVSQVSAIGTCACVVTSGGEVYCWGRNSFGRLGNNSLTDSLVPVRVVGGEQGGSFLTGGIQVSVEGAHSCVVTTDGEVFCWGEGYWGQLGNNSTIYSSSVPVKVVGGAQGGTYLTGVSQISVGNVHTCAVTSNGVLLCWGSNSDGQLGNGFIIDSQVPVKVLGGEQGETYLTSVNVVSALNDYNCALSSGEVYCWGRNDYGQLGNNSTIKSQVPVKVLGGAQGGTYLTGISQVSLGGYHTCGLTTGGEVYCWGYNRLGQLGNNSTIKSQVPVKVLGGAQGGTYLTGISQVSLGGYHTCGLTTGGEVYCWGYNGYGQLGNNSTTKSLVPVKVVGGAQGGTYLTDISQVSGEGYHTCGLTTGGEVYCWGKNNYGQLGNNSTTKSLVPVKVVGGEQGGAYLENICEVSVAINGSCGMTTVGEVYCWGSNSSGELGNNSTTQSLVPVKVLGGEQGGTYLTSIIRISAGCALTSGSEVYCWGSNSSGELGNNSSTKSLVPVKVVGGEQGGTYLTGVTQFSRKSTSICAVSSGEVYCWGSNASGQLGNGKAWYETPQKIYDGNGIAPCTLSCCAQWNYSTIGNACSNGVGACLVSGQMSCEGVGVTGAVICNAIAGTPGEEICSGYDDDCDGVVDEGLDCPTNTPTFTNTITSTNTFTFTNTTSDADGDGIIDSLDKCPNLDDKATFTYTGENEVYYGNTYRNDEDMDQDGIVNCQDECVDDLPDEDLFLDLNFHIKTGCEVTPKGGVTLTITPTNTATLSNTPIVNTPTNTNTVTKTFTLTNTETITPTHTTTFTKTFTNSNTYTKTLTVTKTFTPTKTETPTLTNTITPTHTPTNTETASPTITSTITEVSTIIKTIFPTLENTKIVAPETRLKKPVEVKKIKNHVRMKFEKFDGASLEDNAIKIDSKTDYQYLIHIRKLKRLGNKDKNYQFGRKKLSLQKSNVKTFKNLDKGIYSVRYRIIITNNNITRKTKWCGRNLIVF